MVFFNVIIRFLDCDSSGTCICNHGGLVKLIYVITKYNWFVNMIINSAFIRLKHNFIHVIHWFIIQPYLLGLISKCRLKTVNVSFMHIHLLLLFWFDGFFGNTHKIQAYEVDSICNY